MRQTLCDRCGAIITERDPRSPVNVLALKRPFRDGSIRQWDLCGDCADAAELWVRRG